MAFSFEITRVDRLPGAGVAVLDGVVRGGVVRPHDKVELIHDGRPYLLDVIGIVSGPVRMRDGAPQVSLTFNLRQCGVKLAHAGDLLVSLAL